MAFPTPGGSVAQGRRLGWAARSGRTPVIRFSASLVVVAVGILVAGGVTSKLLLVYIAIALSAVALVFLLIGAFLDRDELHARAEDAPAGAGERADAGRAPDRARADEVGVAAVAAGTRTAES